MRRSKATLALVGSVVACLGAIPNAEASLVVSDSFDVPHDYSGGNVAGTPWNGVLNPTLRVMRDICDEIDNSRFRRNL